MPSISVFSLTQLQLQQPRWFWFPLTRDYDATFHPANFPVKTLQVWRTDTIRCLHAASITLSTSGSSWFKVLTQSVFLCIVHFFNNKKKKTNAFKVFHFKCHSLLILLHPQQSLGSLNLDSHFSWKFL